MAEQRSAYEILGLKENAGKEEIEKRYNILCKKYKLEKSDGSNSGEKVDFNEITMAYNELMGYGSADQDEEQTGREPNILLKKMNVDEKKLKNFWHYHKIHILVGIVLIASIIYCIKVVTGYVEPDLNIALVGRFPFQGVESVETQMQDKLKDVKKVDISTIINWDKSNPSVISAMETKLAALVINKSVDIYLLDEEKLEYLVGKGLLESMDDVYRDIGNVNSDKKELKMKSIKDQTEHIYGIDVSDSSVVKSLITKDEKVIMALSRESKNVENRNKLIRLLLNVP